MSTDPDLSEFFRLSKPKRKTCSIGFALNQLRGREKANLEAALAQDVGIITASAITQWLAARDYKGVSTSAVTSHRRGTCSCAE